MASNGLAKDRGIAEARNRHNRDLALHHANLIQQRKDTELQILYAIEEFLDFPTTAQPNAHNPSPKDVQRFKELIKPFQISDYKDLIEERNIASRCGYVFCPTPQIRTRGAGGADFLRIARGNQLGNKQGSIFVPNSKFEMFCDKWCARQAMAIQVQLSNTPAWERASAGNKVTVTIDADTQSGLEEKLNNMEIGKDQLQPRIGLEQSMAELALERGDTSGMDGRVPATIVHRDTSRMPARPPQYEENEGGTIEGYAPKARPTKTRSGDGNNDDDDDADMDWQLG